MPSLLDSLTFYTLKLTDIIIEANRTNTYKFHLAEDLSWDEGTHIHLAFKSFMTENGPNKDLVHHFSIMSLREEGYVGITTRLPEAGSLFKESLKTLHIGDEMVMFKVSNRMSLKREKRPIVLISMGVAIATIRPLIMAYATTSSNIPSLTSININGTSSHIYKDDLQKIKCHGLNQHFLLSKHDLYHQIHETFKYNRPYYYVVGSDSFLIHISNYLLKHAIKESSIILDKKPLKCTNFFDSLKN